MGFHRGVGDIDNDVHAAAGVPSAGTGVLPDPFPASSTSAVINCRPLCGFGGQGPLNKWKLYFII